MEERLNLYIVWCGNLLESGKDNIKTDQKKTDFENGRLMKNAQDPIKLQVLVVLV
jgi:hypothetical protein